MSTVADEPLRVAIVGMGPKGLFALERLVAHGFSSSRPLELELFDPADAPGAGPNYALDLPPFLRMNFAAEQIDMWPSADRRPATEPASFVDWRRSAADVDEGDYPARATVGRYLNQGFMRLVKAASRSTGIVHRRARVGRISRDERGWILGPVGDRRFDEVLLAVGHAAVGEASLSARPWEHAAPLVPGVFPVDAMLSERTVRPGARVAVRGFALTMIDAALALTEGRGGYFDAQGPARLRYRAAGDEPAAILPFSRTGRPMLAKTGPAWAAERGLAGVAGDASARIGSLGAPVSVERDLAPELARVARESLERLGVRESESTIDDWLAAALGGAAPTAISAPAAELERSLAIAVGESEPDAQWALGHAWRTTYPAIVARLGEGGLEAAEWGTFHRLAAEMERIAFGPPPVNAAKLLALARSGGVDLDHTCSRLETGDGVTRLRGGEGAAEVDVVVDAVLPGPGAMGARQPPIEGLIADGLVRVADGRRGLELTADATCVGASGEPTPGLAAIGRSTEDWVIGNDTLSRSLHDWPDRWARRVAARAAR